jgi:hypothetical protein
MARSVLGLSLLLIMATGCGGSGKNAFPVPAPGDDGGLPGRQLPDASFADKAVDRTPSSDRAVGDGSLGDGGGGEPSLLKVTVLVNNPTKGEVCAAKDRFAPSVDVTIDSSLATGADTVNMVLATVTKMGTKAAGASAKLNETKLEQLPETNVVVHHFTDTPVDISTLASGNYTLKVTASTAGGVTAEETVDFQIDAGPVIHIDSPVENKAYRSSATVDVTITDPLFGPVTPDKVTMLLGQQKLTLAAPSGPDNSQYHATIDFSAYNPPLAGDLLLTVRATNSNGTETVVRRKFVADDVGPVIEDTAPAVGALVGRVITISAKVTDSAGVLDSSVVAVVAHGDVMFEIKLQPSAAGGVASTYTALFDTSRLPRSALFPSISFRASDSLGNESSRGYLLSLDNTPPVADLDAPDFVVLRKINDQFECSWAFDPLGADAVGDGRTVAQLFDIRARVEDQGNDPLSGQTDFRPVSGIDDTRVQLLVLDDTSNPLVVDSDGDGACDTINPLLTPTTSPMSASDALLINMVPISPGGAADFLLSPLSHPACTQLGSASKHPDPMCDTTDLPVVIPAHVGTAAVPAIYTLPPVVVDHLQCVGRQFDALGNHINDGWVCLAVAVWDKLGNAQVSQVLRVCVDKDGTGGECDPATRAPAPNCTGTLTQLKPVPKVDATKPCTPWRHYVGDDNFLWIR